MRWAIRGMVAFAVLVSTTGQTVVAGTAEAAETTGSVEIVIYQAYGDPDRLDFELTHPSGAYRKADCERQEDRDYYGDFPVAQVWLCDDLPIGAYDLELTGVGPDESTFGWDCSDPTGFVYLPYATAPTIGRVGDHPTLGLDWSCAIVSSVPAINVRGVNAAPYAFVEQVELTVTDAGGQPVDGCAGLSPSDWCAVGAPGDYDVVYDGIPEGFRSYDRCRSVSQSPFHAEGAEGASAAVSDSWPMWTCERDLWAPLEFTVETHELDPTSISYELTDADGQPVDGCQWMDVDEAAGGSNAFGACLGLVDGTYRFSASHPSISIAAQCSPGDINDRGEVIVPATDDPTQNVPVVCRIEQVQEKPPTSIPVPAPVVTLPTTGSSTHVAASGVAALLLVAGLAMLVVSGGRRRSWPGRS